MVKLRFNPANPTNSFAPYLLLPPENRMQIIDKMRPGDRIRYTRASRLSRAEATRSKNYIYGLEFSAVEDDNIHINVVYADDDEEDDDDEENTDVYGYGFILEYKIENGKKYMIYSDLCWNELWRNELYENTDLIQLAARQFKEILKKCQNKIKKLTIHHWPYFGDHLHDYDFELDSLAHLEILEIKFNSDIQQQFISKLKHPLKKLSVYDEKNNAILANFEWSSVQEYIFAPHISMNYDQFLQLRAWRVLTQLGELTEENIYNYVKLWQHGKTGKDVECYIWRSEGAEFDIQTLVRLLGVKPSQNEERRVKIFVEHKVEEGRKAVLMYDQDSLTFDTDPASNWDEPTSEDEDESNGEYETEGEEE